MGITTGQRLAVSLPEFVRSSCRQAAGEHQGDFGCFHRVFVHVKAKELFGRNAAGRANFFKLAFILGEQAQQEILFEFAQGAVGDKQEVAAAASGIKHAEGAKLAEEFEQFGNIFGGGDAFFPWTNDGGADNFLDVALVGEVRAERMALRF